MDHFSPTGGYDQSLYLPNCTERRLVKRKFSNGYRFRLLFALPVIATWAVDRREVAFMDITSAARRADPVFGKRLKPNRTLAFAALYLLQEQFALVTRLVALTRRKAHTSDDVHEIAGNACPPAATVRRLQQAGDVFCSPVVFHEIAAYFGNMLSPHYRGSAHFEEHQFPCSVTTNGESSASTRRFSFLSHAHFPASPVLLRPSAVSPSVATYCAVLPRHTS